MPDGKTSSAQGSITLGRLLVNFLKLGSIGFGGGMAVIALMEEEFVRKRRIIEAEEFVHGVGLAQILGPFAVNTSFFIGYRLFGAIGGLLSAGAFLAPSVALVILLSRLYFRYHSIPALQGAVARTRPGCHRPDPDGRVVHWSKSRAIMAGSIDRDWGAYRWRCQTEYGLGVSRCSSGWLSFHATVATLNKGETAAAIKYCSACDPRRFFPNSFIRNNCNHVSENRACVFWRRIRTHTHLA